MAVKATDQVTVVDMSDVASVTWYYLLQSSTLSAPAKPTTNPPSSSWTKTEPTYTEGSTNSLYVVVLTTYGDGTEFSYSDVSKSSSYEAAKAAYNKAAAASTTATGTAKHFFSDTDGIHVTNTENDASTGNNVLIDDDEISIRSGNTALMRITAALIELGINAVNAVISFCGGKGKVGYSTTTPLGETQDSFNVYADTDVALDLFSSTRMVRIISGSGHKANSSAIALDCATGDGATVNSVRLAVGDGSNTEELGAGGLVSLEYAGSQSLFRLDGAPIRGEKIQAGGTSSSTTLSNSTMIQIPPSTSSGNYVRLGSGYTGFSIASNGGIICNFTGAVDIAAGVYIVSAASGSGGVYIRKGTSSTVAATTSNTSEVLGQLKPYAGGSQVYAGPKMVSVAKGDVLHLFARCLGGGSVEPSNVSTYLLVRRVS